MQIQGTVVTIEMNIEIPKRAGGVYQGSRLTYRESDGALKEQCFTSQTLKYNKEINTALSNLSVGSSFTMNKEKEGEFWKVTAITVGDRQLLIPGKTMENTPPSPRSNFETPEERAKKQVYIIRQSSLATAQAFLAANGGKKNTPKELIDTAKILEAYVFSGEFDDGTPYNMISDELE